MILIYSDIQSNRLNYTLNVVFKEVLNCEYELTHNKDAFEQCNTVKLSYSNVLNTGVNILPEGLLFEKNIRKELPNAELNVETFPKFFKSNASDFLGYDLFSTVFYFATRYEEYQIKEVDEHNRFLAENSLLHKFNCLHIPFLNYAIFNFAEKLKTIFPQFIYTKQKINFLSTIDIDNAFAFAHKGIFRNAGGLVKDLFTFNLSQITQRINSLSNDNKDPFNTYHLIHQIHQQNSIPLLYFILIGDYGKFDKNPHYTNNGFIQLLKKLSKEYTLGLHPSYETYNYPEKIKIEKQRLENIIGKKITHARCHFLRVNLPETYRVFCEEGITDDYTMLFATKVGFRTGLCVPIKWFDLELNKATNLTIHTNSIMEGVLRDYNQFNFNKSLEVSTQLINEVDKFGGEFISIYHNDSFTEKNKDWKNLLEKLMQHFNHKK